MNQPEDREQALINHIKKTTPWRDDVRATFHKFACDNESIVIAESVELTTPEKEDASGTIHRVGRPWHELHVRRDRNGHYRSGADLGNTVIAYLVCKSFIPFV